MAVNCTRAPHAFGGAPQPAVMPVDLAMCLSLSQRQPLYQLLLAPPLEPAPRCAPLRPGPFAPRHSSSSSLASPLPSSPLAFEPRRDSGGVKKHVVFADAKGLPLAVVHYFTPEHALTSSTLERTSSAAKPQDLKSNPNKPQRHKFRLAFPQPSLDLKAFLGRLRDTHVQLESCSVSEHSLSGRVCVSHVSNEKAVLVRVTFDSWRSHRDIPCMFLQKLHLAGSDLDVYSFDLNLPQNLEPKERFEFCVSLRPGVGATPHWDDNRGLNYRVRVERKGSHINRGDASRYYSTLSKPRSWSSQLQNNADLQCFQRTLSNRGKTDWSNYQRNYPLNSQQQI
ncbi:protein phosphatase 1 regulatory subunit 3C [Betta splendens]|uniref:Protein phosphatase 1 regulatory subunit 3C n=1 Tax=Betta splendens TaxID=158456 RepID=A0A6P7P1Z2_BETSP|nr:protein phosphatase 1 regulatory subunit 3C [Betta splendens]